MYYIVKAAVIVWWVNFDPSVGRETKKKRPAAIVSNGASNKFLNRLQVVPLTSTTDRLYPSEAVVLFGGKESNAMADQLATVSKTRLRHAPPGAALRWMLHFVHHNVVAGGGKVLSKNTLVLPRGRPGFPLRLE